MTLASLGPVRIQNWILKGSILNDETICLLFFDLNTKSSIIKFFVNEDDALVYLRYVTTTNTDDR
jgi:hypothetical protein